VGGPESERVSRRGFLAGVAALPIAAQFTDVSPSTAHRMEADAGRSGAHDAPVAPDIDRLVPPRPQPHRPGRLREYDIIGRESEIEIAPDLRFAAWTYNGSVPGPVIRATEGDLLRVRFRNEAKHPHTIHFHGVHRPGMDGVLEAVEPGNSFVYEFRARPYGMHLYQCHSAPISEHVQRGLYGAFIVDPPTPRRPARELVMVLSAFDTNGDGANEVYAINGRAFRYTHQPIRVRRSQTVRIYLANLTEHDLVNSFHLHGELFRLYRTGTDDRYERTDTVMLCQGERCILEIDFESNGLYMFHSHQSAFADRGSMGWFNVVDSDEEAAAVEASLLQRYAEQFSRCEPCLGDIGAKAFLKY
jgi:FtsP/CotA-like multicopper oxidase with cupredoxin domain